MMLLKRCLHESQRKTLWLSFVNPRKGRSSRSQMFFKIGVLKNFANFTGKHLCWSLFLIKLQALFNKVSCGISQFFKNTSFFTEHLQRLSLEGVCEGTSFVKILQSCHFNILGINHGGFRKTRIKKNSE